MRTVKLDLEVLERIKHQNKLYSDKALAEAIGISAPLLNQIKSGRRGVSALFITGMLADLNVPFNFLDGSLYVLED